MAEQTQHHDKDLSQGSGPQSREHIPAHVVLPETFTPPAVTPHAQHVPFSAYNNKYSGGACHVIGRGLTDFNYDDLAEINEPVFFINDAVSIEKHAKSETFFFAHDAQLLAWLNGQIRSTAVLCVNSAMFRKFPGVVLRHAGPLVYYRWRLRGKYDLLKLTRDQIAATGELYHHSGTIHSLLHFVWYCGFHCVTFVGCDGISPDRRPNSTKGAYDPRLRNLSRSKPAPWQYKTIRKAQDLLTQLFGFETIYRGTPEKR